jgi:hypothetical protein
MGFDLSRNLDTLSEKDRKLLEEICIREGVSLQVVEKLLKVEKEYQLKERRFGIYKKLKQVLEAEG